MDKFCGCHGPISGRAGLLGEDFRQVEVVVVGNVLQEPHALLFVVVSDAVRDWLCRLQWPAAF